MNILHKITMILEDNLVDWILEVTFPYVKTNGREERKLTFRGTVSPRHEEGESLNIRGKKLIYNALLEENIYKKYVRSFIVKHNINPVNSPEKTVKLMEKELDVRLYKVASNIDDIKGDQKELF